MMGDESETYKSNVNRVTEKIYSCGVEKYKVEGVFVYSVEDSEKFLNWAVLNDFLLHGSTRKIVDDLKPYQASDKIKESGNRKAVYITKVPIVAMFCALTGGVDGLSRRHSSHTRIEKQRIKYDEMYFGVNDISKVKDKGYIYVLGKNQIDEEINGEYLSYKEICPIAIIEVSRKDFPFEINTY